MLVLSTNSSHGNTEIPFLLATGVFLDISKHIDAMINVVNVS